MNGLQHPGRDAFARPAVAPTPCETVYTEGPVRLLRFRPDEPKAGRAPLLIVPSMINRWYIVDLRTGASLVESLCDDGFDVFVLDWGAPGDEERYTTWDRVLERLHRAVRRVSRLTRNEDISLLGYCMGGTLAVIHAALHPRTVRALVNLAGPVDFSEGGFLTHLVNRQWFDSDAIAEAGNLRPVQMQSGFVAIKPTQQLAKWVRFADRMHDPAFVESFQILEQWAGDNIAFPAAAYATYIGDLYQRNALVQGRHRVNGRTARLEDIDAPTLVITASRDHICPRASALALSDYVESCDHLEAPGGHIGAVIGHHARTQLYPQLGDWLARHV